MKGNIPTNGVPIIGQNKILIIVTPGAVTGTFDVTVDTSNFAFGVPFAVQALVQAITLLVPQAYQIIIDTVGKGPGR